MRTFTDSLAKRERVPLLTGIVGPQKSGKTWSALEMATGMQKVFGGDIFLIDTEAGRGLHYAEYFKYRYVPFEPPHGPLDYLAAIEHAHKKGAGVIIIDSMTHEHSGEEGVMDQVEKRLDAKAGDDQKARERATAWAHIVPKAQRKVLNRQIEQMGLNAILCYRAEQKLKYATGQSPKALGWQPDTTSSLFYSMTASFLMPPYSNGVPDFSPENPAEKLFIALPAQFRGWFKEGMRLSQDVGQRMAEWAMGDEVKDDRKALLERVKAVFQRDFPGTDADSKAARLTHMKLAFGVTSWRELEALPIPAIEASLMQVEPTITKFDAGEREPGGDDE